MFILLLNFVSDSNPTPPPFNRFVRPMEIMVLCGERVPLFEIFDFSTHLNLDFVTIYSPT